MPEKPEYPDNLIGNPRDMDLSKEFPQEPGISYLNHAGVGPWPQRTADAIATFARENVLRGARHYPQWLRKEERLREQLAKLINAPSPADIALVKSTSEALSFIAYGLDWRNGDEIVITDQEFPSNRIVWESLQRFGVRVNYARLSGDDGPEEAILAAVTPRTRLVSVSSVQYATGLRLDLRLLGDALRQKNILFCVDAIQSIGAVEFDCQAINADFVAADGHKWMLGPEGMGLFYCRPPLRDRLQLTEFGWHMVEDRGNYDREDWSIAADARRFECGSPNMLGIHGLSSSLELILAFGVAQVESLLLQKTRLLQDKLEKIPGTRLITPREDHRRAGIVTFIPPGEPGPLQQALMKQNVVCASRGGGIRFSPHFYTPVSALEMALDQYRTLCR